MAYFSFSDINTSYWNSSNIADRLSSFFGFFLIYPNIIGHNYTSSKYIITIYVAIACIVVIFLFLFYVNLHSKYKLPFHWPLVIARYLILLSQQVLFVPFINLFANIYGCSSITVNGISKTVLTDFNDMECWTGIHILHCFFALVFAALLALLVLFTVRYNIY